MTRIAFVQHLEEEGPGTLATWAKLRGVELTGYHASLGRLPDRGAYDGLVLLGGPWQATAREPGWLEDERRWLADAIDDQAPLFGICLGAQLIAAALPGGGVRCGTGGEAGWIEVELTSRPHDIPEGVRVLSWHEDSFVPPPDAHRFARSPSCPEQGFRVGEGIVAIQFHPEWTPEIVAALRRRFANEMPDAVQPDGDYATVQACFWRLLDDWRSAF